MIHSGNEAQIFENSVKIGQKVKFKVNLHSCFVVHHLAEYFVALLSYHRFSAVLRKHRLPEFSEVKTFATFANDSAALGLLRRTSSCVCHFVDAMMFLLVSVSLDTS